MARKSDKAVVDIEELLRDHLRELGAKGGKARAANLTGKERSASAKKAAVARWGKKKGKA